MTAQSKTKLIGVLPFIDSDGLMRAKGRLRRADVEYQTINPINQHCQYWAVNLFAEDKHKTRHHVGVEFLRSVFQQRFWIFGLRNVLR